MKAFVNPEAVIVITESTPAVALRLQGNICFIVKEFKEDPTLKVSAENVRDYMADCKLKGKEMFLEVREY